MSHCPMGLWDGMDNLQRFWTSTDALSFLYVISQVSLPATIAMVDHLTFVCVMLICCKISPQSTVSVKLNDCEGSKLCTQIYHYSYVCNSEFVCVFVCVRITATKSLTLKRVSQCQTTMHTPVKKLAGTG